MSDKQPSQEKRLGIARMSLNLMNTLLPEVAIEKVTTQGELNDAGVLQRLNERLLLPPAWDDLKVVALFFYWPRDEWHLYLSGSTMPVVEENQELLHVELDYEMVYDEKGEVLECADGRHGVRVPNGKPVLRSFRIVGPVFIHPDHELRPLLGSEV